MGMYDVIENKDGATLLCPKGHIIPSLQTKDFECWLDTYVLEQGRLKLTKELGGGKPFPRATELTGDHDVSGCAFCHVCFPYDGPDMKIRTFSNGQTSTEYGPLYEFTLQFRDGKLTMVTRDATE